MNYWPVISLILASTAAVLGFGAGAATGATFSGVEFNEVFIPMFSALGGWVSGAGALAAVGTTIYFYKKQEEANEENLEVIVYAHEGYLSVDVLCLSRQPAFVTDIYFEHGDKYYFMSRFDKRLLNVQIMYKEKKTFELIGFGIELQREFGLDLTDYAKGISVETTMGDYSADDCFV